VPAGRRRGRGSRLAVLLAAASVAAASADVDAPTPDWRNGPVRYLLTRAEDQAFKGLRAEADRAAFIAAFWARRDPTPGTRRNEFKERFEDRVKATEALRRYQESTKPPWMTDLGKYMILLGPPLSEERSQVADSTRDTVIWTYDEVPGVLDRNFTLAFVADESGELRLSASPAIDMATTQGLAPHTPLYMFEPAPVRNSTGALTPTTAGDAAPAAPTGGMQVVTLARAAALGGASTAYDVARFEDLQGVGVTATAPFLPLAGVGAFAGDPLLAALGGPTAATDLGRLAGLAGAAGTLGAPRTRIDITTSFHPVSVDLRTDFYAAADGTTYTAFTLAPSAGESAIGGAAAAPAPAGWVPFGGLVSLDHPEVSFSLADAAEFAAAPEAPAGTFQTGLGVDPGRYRALFGLQDPATGRVGYRQEEITVPDLRRSPLALSSLTLARSIGPAGTAPSSAVKVPFVLGSLRVVPRTDATLRNGDDFEVYYQIYGATTGPDGHPSLAIRYSFAGRAGEDWQAIGGPIEQEGTSAAQAWTFPLKGWPSGGFRLTVDVQDRLAGYTAHGELEFRVAE
jgi:GWxTD domain-containing protein